MSGPGGLHGLMKYRYQKREPAKLENVSSPSAANSIVNGHCNGQISVESPKTNKALVDIVPETPESQRASEPSSPVFNSVKKSITHTPTKSPGNSPWLSKAALIKGSPSASEKSDSQSSNSQSSNSQSSNSQSSATTDSTMQSSPLFVKPNPTSAPCLTEADREFISQISNLQGIFPQKHREECVKAFKAANQNFDLAVDYLIDGKYAEYTLQARKREREPVGGSPLSSPVNPPPYKRVRMLSSDSDDSMPGPSGASESPLGQKHSQSSAGGFSLNSQQSNTESPTKNDKMIFLQDAFPRFPKNLLVETLRKHDGNLDQTTTALSEMCSKQISQTENVGSIKAMQEARIIAKATGQVSRVSGSYDDDGEPPILTPQSISPTKVISKNESPLKGAKERREKRAKQRQQGVTAGSDDEDWTENDGFSSDEEVIESDTGQQGALLKFMNEAGLSDLLSVSGCSKKKAEHIISLRPFESFEDMAVKFEEKPLSIQLIGDCKELLRIRDIVQKLMKKCERICQDIESVLCELTNNVTLEQTNSNIEYISQQPKLLNSDMKLTPYQMIGLNWLVLMHEQELNGILGDEMGLGKTIQTIAFLAQMKEAGKSGPHIIIAPSSTLDNWLRELKVWCPSLKVLLYYGSQEERAYLRQQILTGQSDEFDVAVTTYNMAAGSVEDRNLFKKFPWHYAIFDEGHMLKNMSSMRYKTLMRIQASRRLLLTGTPLQNNLVELMSLLAFVMPEMFTNKTDYLKKIFSTMTGKSGDENRSKYEAENVAHAKRILKPFFLRRLKTEVLQQLPKKTEKIEHVPMAYEQQELYDDLKLKFSTTLRENKGGLQGKSGAAMMMELRKAANHHLLHRKHYDVLKLRKMAREMIKEPTHTHAGEQFIFEDMEVMSDFELHLLCLRYRMIRPFMLDDDLIVESGKFRFLDELLAELQGKGSRVLLFSQFTMMLDIIESYMQIRKHQYLRLDGQTVVAERQDLIDKFNNDQSIFVFLLSTKAGGMGINLTAADTVILHDIDFNPYNDKQAEDRCHRLGQTREVTVYRLLSAASIEEGMWKCAQGKLNLERDVTSSNKDDKENSNDVASLLSEALNLES